MEENKIYILKLEDNKYYIGKTGRDVNTRFTEHVNGYGSEWTKKHKPIKIINSSICLSKFDEDNITKEYMIKYGIENVRGGTYCKLNLEDFEIKVLENEFNGINNKCYKCGEDGHYAKNCLTKYNDYISLFSTKEELEKEINAIKKYIMNIKNYNNPFRYITCCNITNKGIYPVQKKDIQEVLLNIKNTTISFSDFESDVNIINLLNSYIIQKKQQVTYNNNNNNKLELMNKNLKLKNAYIYDLFIKKRKYEEDFLNTLNETDRIIFKENNYENIYDLIKDELCSKLELLYEKLLKFYLL